MTALLISIDGSTRTMDVPAQTPDIRVVDRRRAGVRFDVSDREDIANYRPVPILVYERVGITPNGIVVYEERS